MSTNCIRCVVRKRTGNDLLCDDCRELGRITLERNRLIDELRQLKSRLAAERDAEKERRIYYQNIVYSVCNSIDQCFGSRPGMGVVCGTADEPTTEVQQAISHLCKQLADAKARENVLRDFATAWSYCDGHMSIRRSSVKQSAIRALNQADAIGKPEPTKVAHIHSDPSGCCDMSCMEEDQQPSPSHTIGNTTNFAEAHYHETLTKLAEGPKVAKDRKCGTCKHMNGSSCTRFPPQWMPKGFAACYPLVYADMASCGEWQRKEVQE
jgi:hypothetical protein